MADRLGHLLETLIEDRRARIAGAIVGALVLVVSMGLLVASKGAAPKAAASLAAHLPERTLVIPILRSLPEPQPRRVQATERVDAPARKKARARYVTARR